MMAHSLGCLARAQAGVPLDEIEHISAPVANAAANFYVSATRARHSLAFNSTL
jgi:hypothetical protein